MEDGAGRGEAVALGLRLRVHGSWFRLGPRVHGLGFGVFRLVSKA